MRHEQTAASEPAAGTTRTLEKAGIELVYVPAGEFTMGSSADDTMAKGDEKPAHAVFVDGYWIGQTAVTNAQYRRFMEAGGYSKGEYWTEAGRGWLAQSGAAGPDDNPEPFDLPNHPQVGVNWFEAAAFAKWAGGRLPTEAEWEYAARGGPLTKGHRYAGSDDANGVAWYEGNAGYGTHPVGQKRPNELGLYDMSGNVWEWCADRYEAAYYAESPRENPQGAASGGSRVWRGGSWLDDGGAVRCATRGWFDSYYRYYHLGFRLVLGS
ncbi:MAG: formylglycine-generating enzyme family protein [Anaerolineales bacterium]|nr:MAG: formylglycine-generating enzyme family protein [Anaerolineales bacterium]